jgi:hypothetical protein
VIATPEPIDVPLRVDQDGVIYAVIAYYLNHREEVDAYIEQEEAEAEKWRQEYEANNPQVAASNAKFRALLNEKRKNESG